MTNPFNVSFGKKPYELLSRSDTLNEISNIFESENPTTETYIITGPRGSGKTVELGKITEYFESKEDWIIADLNPYLDMHEQLAARIYASDKFKKVLVKSEFSFSFKGIGFSISGNERVNDIFTLLEKMFKYLKEKNIKVLVSIDDISNNKYVRAFVYSYQRFLRSGYKTFFVATSLYKNIVSLQSNKSLTFLIRAPKIVIKPLNLRAVYFAYKKLLNVSDEVALELARTSKGYAFGFQLLGNLMFNGNEKQLTENVLNDFDLELENKVYSMIWSEFTDLEKSIISYIAAHDNCTREEVNTYLNLKGNSISIYKKGLINQGVLSDENRGKFEFYLPRFKEFVNFQNELLD